RRRGFPQSNGVAAARPPTCRARPRSGLEALVGLEPGLLELADALVDRRQLRLQCRERVEVAVVGGLESLQQPLALLRRLLEPAVEARGLLLERTPLGTAERRLPCGAGSVRSGARG